MRRLVPVLLAGLLAGCAAPAAAGPTAPVDVALEVADGTVTGAGPRIEVPLGATLRLAVRSDRADELHVHGYDRTLALEPGSPAPWS